MLETPMQTELEQLLVRLQLKSFLENYQSLAETTEEKKAGCITYLTELCREEANRRDQVTKERLLKASKIPRSKTLESFEVERVPGLTRSKVQWLMSGSFMDHSMNLLFFGNSGTGKTHLCLGLTREWCLMGRRILYKNAAMLIEELQVAESQNQLTKALKKLDTYHCVILDDITYVPWTPIQSRLLFQLIDIRYEQRSLVITSNQPFGEWNGFFDNKQLAAAIIDRLVHHSELLELNTSSYRAEVAKNRKKKAIDVAL